MGSGNEMKRLSIYFLDGKSLAFSLDDNEFAVFVAWLNGSDNKPYKISANKMEHYIFKHSIEYIIS